MDTEAIQRLFAKYSLVPRTIHGSQKGYRNISYPATLKDGRTVNLIVYKSEPGILERIQRANYVADYAAKAGLPVRRLADERILRLKSVSRVAYGALYEYLPGKTIPWEAFTKDHIKLAGMAMSTLHARIHASRSAPLSVADEYRQYLIRMQYYFEDTNVERALAAKLRLQPRFVFKRFEGIMTLCDRLPGQNLHMDFVRGNLLFDKARPTDLFAIEGLALSGIIDFEKTAYGPPVFDIARTLAFLLVDCPVKSPEKIRKYFLQSGYNKRGESVFRAPTVMRQGKSFDLLDELTTLFLIYDFYKFLRHNPYEFLNENHHFVRTRDILIGRKMLQYI
jgi:Ser/Thr protein kinase RdoA (MazF antagonist)